MRSRRSVRSFKATQISRDEIKELIEMAITAPSASNSQAWRFFVVENRDVIQKMVKTIQNRNRQIEEYIHTSFADRFKDYGDYFIRFRDAPIVIVPTYRNVTILSSLLDQDAEQSLLTAVQKMESGSGLLSVSLAIENLLLFVHSKGLGASCMTGPLIAAKELRDILKIPSPWEIAALIPVGHPNEDPEQTTRKPADQIIRWVE